MRFIQSQCKQKQKQKTIEIHYHHFNSFDSISFLLLKSSNMTMRPLSEDELKGFLYNLSYYNYCDNKTKLKEKKQKQIFIFYYMIKESNRV